MSLDRATRTVAISMGANDMIVPGFASTGGVDAVDRVFNWSSAGVSRGLVQLSSGTSEFITGVFLLGVGVGRTFYNGSAKMNLIENFGGIAKDLTSWGGPDVIEGEYSVTTNMPNNDTGLVDYIFVNGVGLVKALYFANDGLVFDDPSGSFSQLSSGTEGCCINSRLEPPVKVRITPDGGGSLWIGYPGDYYQSAANLPVDAVFEAGDGVSAISPFAVLCNAAYTIQLTY